MGKKRKYEIPDFLAGTVTQEQYERWMRRKAQAHVRRDRRRGNKSAIGEEYRLAIHRAVIESDGRDCYTGEDLDWSLISKYDNARSKTDGRRYKALFALLPTVDHVNDELGPVEFKICAWRTNDAKSDMSLPEFVELCERVVRRNSDRPSRVPP